MRRVIGIRRPTLRMILEASRDTYPNEFGAILKVDDEGAIAELLLLPGTIQGEHSALFHLHMLPPDFDVVGTIHSHPNGVCYPSDADRHLWTKFGGVHLIAGHPYGPDDWNAFSHRGEQIGLPVLGRRSR